MRRAGRAAAEVLADDGRRRRAPASPPTSSTPSATRPASTGAATRARSTTTASRSRSAPRSTRSSATASPTTGRCVDGDIVQPRRHDLPRRRARRHQRHVPRRRRSTTRAAGSSRSPASASSGPSPRCAPGAPFNDIGRAIQEHAEAQRLRRRAQLRRPRHRRAVPHRPARARTTTSRGSPRSIEEGMTFTIEPMITMGAWRARPLGRRLDRGHRRPPPHRPVRAHARSSPTTAPRSSRSPRALGHFPQCSPGVENRWGRTAVVQMAAVVGLHTVGETMFEDTAQPVRRARRRSGALLRSVARRGAVAGLGARNRTPPSPAPSGLRITATTPTSVSLAWNRSPSA